MYEFEYHEPQSLAEATSLLVAYAENARVLAGGTDLIVQMRKGLLRPHHLIDIKKIPGLDQLTLNEDTIEIGAAVTLSAAERFLAAFAEYGVLSQAIHSVASVQIRHRATLAGNICNASPAADTAPALVVLGAKVKLHGTHGERLVAVEKFFAGPRKTVLLNGEVVSAIVLPRLDSRARGVFLRKARRPSVDLATVNVAIFSDGTSFRIALGAVAPTVIRVRAAEQLVKESGLSPATIAQAAELACQTAKPIGDVRGSAAYRLELVAALTKRALSMLAATEERK
jgi:carbon-monoxide dehydrogenase medium subunit